MPNQPSYGLSWRLGNGLGNLSKKKNSGTWEVVIKELTVMVGFREHGPRKLSVLHNFTRKHEGFLVNFPWSQSWMIIP